MSKTKIPLDRAQKLANEVVELLSPACDRIEIAGSIRRRKPEIGDIEIVCIPTITHEYDMFGEVIRTKRPIDASIPEIFMRGGDVWFRVNGQKMKSFYYKKTQVDLFLTTLEQWGYIFTLRTGSADFSHRMVTPKRYGGHRPDYVTFENGYVYVNDQIVSVPTEAEFFELLEIDYVKPENR